MERPLWDGTFDEWIPEHWHAHKLVWLLCLESEDTVVRVLDYTVTAVGNDLDTKLMRAISLANFPTTVKSTV